MVMSSTKGRCGSITDTSEPASSDNSAREPTAVRWSASQRQMGSGVPQYRERESAQSMLLRSQSPYRPHWIVCGYQFVASFCANNSSLIAVVRMYQDGNA